MGRERIIAGGGGRDRRRSAQAAQHPDL